MINDTKERRKLAAGAGKYERRSMMKAWQRYQQNEIMTSNPIKNTIYIYERCILEFKKIDDYCKSFKYKELDVQLEKMEKIFEELKLQLNPNVDKELYENLHALYDWIAEQIRIMKMTRKASEIDTIIYVLKQLTDGYKGVLEHA